MGNDNDVCYECDVPCKKTHATKHRADSNQMFHTVTSRKNNSLANSIYCVPPVWTLYSLDLLNNRLRFVPIITGHVYKGSCLGVRGRRVWVLENIS